jgi:hypothetical protein
MSDDFHVHGPHDHEVEHVSHHSSSNSFANQIAVTTAILATIGAIYSPPPPIKITPRLQKRRHLISGIIIRQKITGKI